MTAGTGKGALAGTVKLSGGSYLRFGTAGLSTTFKNSGTIKLDDAGSPDDFYVLGSVTFAGNGKIDVLGDGAFIANISTATLTNDATISGLAVISGADLSFVNGAKGVVDANASGGYLGFSPGSATNSGLMEATTGRMDIQGNITQTASGKIKAANAGSSLTLVGSTIVGGTVSTVKGSFLLALSGSGTSVIDTTKAIVNAGTMETYGGSTGANLVLTGEVKNTGALLAAGGNSIFAEAKVTGGTAEITGASEIDFEAQSSAKVAFDPTSTGLLVLEDAQKFTGTVAGMSSAPGAAIDLENMLFADGPTVNFDAGKHLLTVTDPVKGITDKIKIVGTGTFTDSNAADGSTLISDPPANAVNVPENSARLLAQSMATFGATGGLAASDHHGVERNLTPPDALASNSQHWAR